MKRILLMALLCAISLAIGAYIGLRSAGDAYTVVIKNNSPHALTDFRVVGGGCDEHFDSILPEETVKHTFVIEKDGKLKVTGHGENHNGPATYDEIIDEHVEKGREGMSTVTVDQDGDLSAISEKGN